MKNNGKDMEKKSTADYKHSDTQETPDVNKLLDKKEKKRQKKTAQPTELCGSKTIHSTPV